jgi:predicted enzyme related to lactoylglutathione lyase
MTLKLGMITLDTHDALPLATWWAAQLDAEVAQTNEGWYVVLAGGGLPALMAFQQVEDPTPGKNKMHLDLTASDVDAEVDRLLAAGAGLVERRSMPGFSWVTMTDPQGNEFCVAGDHEANATF